MRKPGKTTTKSRTYFEQVPLEAIKHVIGAKDVTSRARAKKIVSPPGTVPLPEKPRY